eukprot:277462_1
MESLFRTERVLSDSNDQDTPDVNIPTKDCHTNEKPLMLWQMESLLQFKSEFEIILNKEFDDEFYLKHIKTLYPIIRHKTHVSPHSKPKPKQIQSPSQSATNRPSKYFCDISVIHEDTSQPNELTLFREIYELSTESTFMDFAFVPVKIDYFMFHPRFNRNFHHILYHECVHCNRQMSSFHFTSAVAEYLKEQLFAVGYTTKLPCDPEEQDLFSATNGCCMECAALITPLIIMACKAIKRANSESDEADGPLPMNIDALCVLCIWISNILQHKYIKQCLQNDSDIMPTMLLAIYTLMVSAHTLYKDKRKLYKKKRNVISFAIYTSLKQVLLNHDYIRKYYQSVDHDKDRFCESYLIQIVEWMMAELHIVDEMLHCRKSSRSVMHSLDYDYFGCIVVLMSMLPQDFNQYVRGMTCQCTHTGYEFVMEFWMTMHLISHSTDEISKFFAGSIRRCREIKNTNEIKCQWRKCRKWRKANKFYKCKTCKAVSYCSRHCQKKDWIYGAHCMVCEEYN